MTLRKLTDLAQADLINDGDIAALSRVAERYAISITPAIAKQIDPANPADPLARQFVPTPHETDKQVDETPDPIGDAVHAPVNGLVHRYPDRVLFKPTGVCPVYCRYCFRREKVGPQNGHTLSSDERKAAYQYIAADPRIWEVIVTGGDPFILSPRRIQEITRTLAAIEHVKIVRWHTRVPVVQPNTLTQEFVSALRADQITTYVALHANHAREFTPQARCAISRIVDAGIPMLSQTVLLRGINDNVETLCDLMRTFVENRIKPYYLHHLDRAPGTAHFRVPLETGRSLVSALQGTVSGTCQPTYILDLPGGHGKVPVGPVYAETADAGEFILTNYRGIQHRYRE